MDQLQMLPGQIDDFRKGIRVANGDFGKALSIQLDHGALEAPNQLAITEVAHAAGGADARNPQTSERSFAHASIAKGIHAPAHQGHE
jgi:hypothetical protein